MVLFLLQIKSVPYYRISTLVIHMKVKGMDDNRNLTQVVKNLKSEIKKKVDARINMKSLTRIIEIIALFCKFVKFCKV